MKFPKLFTAGELAALCDAEVLGDPSTPLHGMNEIHKVQPGDLMFVDNEKYFRKSLESEATAILINQKIPVPDGKVLLHHPQPFDAYNALAWHFRPFMHSREAISPLAIIDPSATIEPGVVIGAFTRVGAGTYIQANAYIGPYTEIGEKVIIHPACVVGNDAFYYHKTNLVYTKWRSIGRVVVEDEVEIGSNCTIARGVSGDTVLGFGSKLDCQVHIGHGVRVGKHCLMAAQVAIGGKTLIGDHVTMYGQVGVAQNLKIGDHAVLLAKTGVSKDLPGGITYYGIPAEPANIAYKQLAMMRQLARSKNKS
jgi:UDP-3-O-[3-hydroxymyristoyl] glucosamine N-acyltransferase